MSALSGFRILELSNGVGGEYCGKLLADFGAEIIKIERPGSGSATRSLSPFAPGVDGVEASGLFAYLNTGKQSVTLDLSGANGRAALAQLLPRVDAVIDDHAPGRAEERRVGKEGVKRWSVRWATNTLQKTQKRKTEIAHNTDD